MEQFSFPFLSTSAQELPPAIQSLIAAAAQAATTAYAPYSGFKVGAAVLLTNGNIKTGSNHENASYPAGVCAETSLLSTLNPTDPANCIEAIAISYLSNGNSSLPLAPCGICRQSLLEQQLAQHGTIAVYMTSPTGAVIHIPDAASLLPFYFSNKNL